MSLNRIMSIPHIQDEIMQQTSPLDSLNLVLTHKDMLQKCGTANHMNIFKHIIQDKKWLSAKLRDGYTFTLVSPSLARIMNTSSDPAKVVVTSLDELVYSSHEVILIVTKDERFVPCTDEFLPRRVLTDFSDEREPSIVTEGKYEPDTRIERLKSYSSVIKLMCPLVSQSTDVPLFLYFNAYMRTLMANTIHRENNEINTMYTHMTQASCSIHGPVGEHSLSPLHTKTLFSIGTRVPGNYAVHIRILKHALE